MTTGFGGMLAVVRFLVPRRHFCVVSTHLKKVGTSWQLIFLSSNLCAKSLCEIFLRFHPSFTGGSSDLALGKFANRLAAEN